MTHDQIIADIRKKEFKPVYFLHGTEPFFMDEITKVFEEEILNESEKAFNMTVMYGKDSHFKTVVDAARRFPVMASHQVVILKEAQEMKTLGELKTYAQNPAPTTLMLIVHKHKKYDMRSAFGKAAKASGIVLECKQLYDNQVPAWIRKSIKSRGYDVEDRALELLTEYLGTELSKISNELDKLSLNIEKGTVINTDLVQKNIGISKDYNVFELQDAIGAKNREKCVRIIRHFAANPRKHSVIHLLASLYSYFSKLYIAGTYSGSSDLELAKAMGFKFRDERKAQYAAKHRVAPYRIAMRNYSRQHIERAFNILKEYDLRSKGVGDVGTPQGELMKELVLKILG